MCEELYVRQKEHSRRDLLSTVFLSSTRESVRLHYSEQAFELTLCTKALQAMIN